MVGLGVWTIVGWMVAACGVVGVLRNDKSVDQAGIFIPILALVVGFLLGANGSGPVWRTLEIILLAAAGGFLSGEFDSENAAEFSDRLPTFIKYLVVAVLSVWLSLGSWFETSPPGLDFLQQYLAKPEERQVVLIAGVYPMAALATVWAVVILFGGSFLALDWLKNGPSEK